MELRTLHLLCYLCAACTLVQSRWSNSVRETQSDSVSEESTGLFSANNLRDKRALGLILSGLAQVFGYAVEPVQIASLPNPNSEAGVTNGTRTNSTESNNGSTTSAAGQRETIRFTGVVNLGNGTDVLTQLQRYENIFHGGSSSSNGGSSSPPQIDPKTQAPDQPQPLFVKRLPSFVTESPLPTVPQAPLPEIPSQFINLSYPEPYVAPVRGGQDTGHEKQNTTVKDQPPTAGRLPTTSAPSVQGPGWKQEYEDRLAELERKQEEHARRLTEQERYRDGRKNGNYGGSKKQINQKGRESGCKGESDEEKQSGEEDRSRDRYESGEKITTSDKESEEERYGNYKNDDIYKEDTPLTGENYTSILQYSSEPLPLSEDDEQRRPEDLRNSYGEPLFNRELLGFANFFGKFKQPLSDIYSSSAPPESKEESSEEEEDSRGEQKGEDESDEEDGPARNKYEEYTLEGDASNGREGEKKPKESPMKIFNNESNDESPSSTDELDFSKFMPLIVPVRYLTAPEESRKTQLKSRAEVSKKVSPKESKRPKKENVKPVAGLAERRTPKKLHEGEQKETRVWPPPFDFVFDGTIHTNVVSENSSNNDDVKVSNDRGNNGESESSLRKERNRVTLDDSTRKPCDYPESIYHQNFKKGYGTVPGKQIAENGTTNGEEIEPDHDTTKPDQDDDDGKEVPDFLKRYKYTSSDDYGIAKRITNIGTENLAKLHDSSSLRSKNLESPKRSIERDEQSLESEQQLNVKNRVMQDVPAPQRKFQSTMFFDPVQSYNLFNFDASVYDLNYGRRNERLSGISEGGKNIGNEERVSLAVPQQNVYRYDESLTKFASEPESKAVKDKREEMQRRSELEHKMTEILENLKTRLLVE
ncbi:hypothetical protein WN51_13635 [Melipona quadrifasciata]|uniref:Uncharacterized protein n=1 Tax=Melipona quadrifasciata TaxID=166423 RepID=A0A0M9A326_9HYME|nr:hypothetical protein WN51_13635 [Melipona quadrifasciata]